MSARERILGGIRTALGRTGPLDDKDIEAIAAIQLKVLHARLAKMDIALDVAPAALAEIAKVGFDPVFGARPLKRAIQQRIENPLSKLLLEGAFGPKEIVTEPSAFFCSPGVLDPRLDQPVLRMSACVVLSYTVADQYSLTGGFAGTVKR